MQSFKPSIWNVARDSRHSVGLRYAVQRLAELLDPHAHFAASASFTLDPLTGSIEFVELAQAYHLTAGTNPSMSVMVHAAERTRHALTADRNLRRQYAAEHQAAVDALRDAIDFAAAKAAGISKKKWFDPRVAAAARGPMRLLRATLTDPATGYKAILVDSIEAACLTTPATRAEWLQLDDDLRFVASLALADGRDGMRFCRAIGAALARSNDEASAVANLITALNEPAEPHLVALRLLGLRHPLNVTAFGCRWAPAGGDWGVPVPTAVDTALRNFIRAKRDSAVVITQVDAFDFSHARVLGAERAEQLLDQYRAQHRAYQFAIDAASLVLRTRDSRLNTSDASSTSLMQARARLSKPEPRLDQSLRYAALARSERASVVKVLHSWIALETLSRGQGAPLRPYPFCGGR